MNKKQITPDEFFKLFGEMFAGMSVPGSMGMLGAACKPWGLLKTELRIPGYPDAEECEAAARNVLQPASAMELLKECKAALEHCNELATKALEIRAALIAVMPRCKHRGDPETTEDCGRFASWGMMKSHLYCEEHKYPEARLNMEWEAARLAIEPIEPTTTAEPKENQ